MINISDLKAGDILHDCHSERAGNTMMRREGHWTCQVKEVNHDEHWALISWNGNPARKMYAIPSAWKRHPKEWLRSDPFGRPRCVICWATQDNGHKEDCDHPKAIAARKKMAKAKR